MELALAHHRKHPETSLRELSGIFKVPKSTLNDRIHDTHASRGTHATRNLSLAQEDALAATINSYASRGTLLRPKHITQLACELAGHPVGKNWTTTFLRRRQDVISSRFYQIQEVHRLNADTPANRQAFYKLVKTVMDTGLYAAKDIYNMDETGFNLNSSRKYRRVGPKGSSIRSQGALTVGAHITVIGTISTTDSPVPPLLVYPGAFLLEEWVQVRDTRPHLMATVTETGYSNSFITKQWLRDCFDPYTRNRANGARRLLFLDGHNIHITVDFLEDCWARNIVCIILPAHLTHKLQPLDVNFYNQLKDAYSSQVDDFQQGSFAHSAPKRAFYRWFQRAWAATATSRQIRSAWAKTGLFPLSQEIMGALSSTPPHVLADITLPNTPHHRQELQSIKRLVRQGNLDLKDAFLKTEKALDRAFAEVTLLKQELLKRQASDELDKAARAGGKRTRFPQGHLFDQRYQEEHAAELAVRKEAERKAREKRAAQARSKGKGKRTATETQQQRRPTCPPISESSTEASQDPLDFLDW